MSLTCSNNLKRKLTPTCGSLSNETNALHPSGLFQSDIKEREMEYVHWGPEMSLELLNARAAFQRHCPVKGEYQCCSCPPSLCSSLPHTCTDGLRCRQAD